MAAVVESEPEVIAQKTLHSEPPLISATVEPDDTANTPATRKTKDAAALFCALRTKLPVISTFAALKQYTPGVRVRPPSWALARVTVHGNALSAVNAVNASAMAVLAAALLMFVTPLTVGAPVRDVPARPTLPVIVLGPVFVMVLAANIYTAQHSNTT